MNVAEGKILWSVNHGIVTEMNIVLYGQVLDEVEAFKYLGALVSVTSGGVKVELQ